MRLRALDLRYVQPALEWPPRPAPAKQLLLCYAAAGLSADLAKSEALEVLTWTYTSLYAEDVLEDPVGRPAYARHIRGLLQDAAEGLPDPVPLVRYRELER